MSTKDETKTAVGDPNRAVVARAMPDTLRLADNGLERGVWDVVPDPCGQRTFRSLLRVIDLMLCRVGKAIREGLKSTNWGQRSRSRRVRSTPVEVNGYV